MDPRAQHAERKQPTKKFSLDSFRPGHSRRSSSESIASTSTSAEHKHTRGFSKFTPLKEVAEEGRGSRGASRDNVSIFSGNRSASPGPFTSEDSRGPKSKQRDRKAQASGSSRIEESVPPTPSTVDTHDTPPTPSSSTTRWNSIRQHVLPSQNHSVDESQSGHQPSPSSSTWNLVPPRSQTPKPSRLAQRLGFRQVVEQAKEAVEDDTRKFDMEIKRACWNIRGVPESVVPAKPNIHTTMGSTLHLPFLSSTSLATVATTTGSTAPTSQYAKKGDLRRPPSLQLLADKGRSVGSVASLHQVLSFYASLAVNGGIATRLPSESLVLSTLTYPFLTYGRSGMEEEKGIALQAFDLIFRTWHPLDEVIATERVLFCIKLVFLLCPGETSDRSIPPQTPLRMHVLNTLYNMTVSKDTFYPVSDPRSFVALMHGLFMLLPAVECCEALQTSGHSQSPHTQAETQIPEQKRLLEIIDQVKAGSCGELDGTSIEEEYSALIVGKDDPKLTRDALALEAWAKCVEFGSNELKRALIRRGIEDHWFGKSQDGYTPLLVAIKSRVLGSFTRAIISLLSNTTTLPAPATGSSATPNLELAPSPITPSSSHTQQSFEDSRQLREVDGTLVIWALQTRVLPELDALEAAPSGGTGVEEARRNVVRIVLELLMSRQESGLGARFSTGDGIGQLVSWSTSMIGGWCREKDGARWKGSFEKVMHDIVNSSQWPYILQVVRAVIEVLSDDVRMLVLMIMLPLLQERLVNDPPSLPTPTDKSNKNTDRVSAELTSLMNAISSMHPKLFYRPLFTLAASSRDYAVATHLCTLVAIARWLPDFWVRDAEMIAVAVMSDLGAGGKSSSQSISSSRQYGFASLGQSVILVEVIGQIQKARRAKEMPSYSPSALSDKEFVEIAKFVLALETRLALLIEAKEKTTLIPTSQRLLFMVLFREIRLLTKSLKAWLPRFVTWFVNYHKDRDALEDEMANEIALIQQMYALAEEGTRPTHQKHRSTLILTPAIDGHFNASQSNGQLTGLAAVFGEKSDLLNGIGKGFARRALKLMVTMSAIITADDYTKIGTLLWEHHMDEGDPNIDPSQVCFLLNQCAEKTPMDLLANIEVDLRSLNDNKRLQAIKHLSTLISWRFQVMSQPLVTDRAHRPFKMARAPLQFVATDMGSSLFVLEIDPNEVKDKQLPLELRKQLAEMGWESDDSPVNKQLEWIHTPMSNLPPLQVDRVEVGSATEGGPMSPSLSPRLSPTSPLESEKAEEVSLLRRNSSSGGPLAGLKRRAVFVPTLGQLLPRIAELVFDPVVSVASASRSLVMDLMRNDPGLLTRPVWDLLSGDEHDFNHAITTISTLLHVRHVLPPAMSHTTFNHLAGFLKFASKQMDGEDSLHKYGLIMTLVGRLATQVSNMSIREMRKAKLEVFFIPSGSLWFPSSAPAAPMFPRGPGFDNPFENDVSARLVSTTVVRISQNVLLHGILKRNPAEIQVVRKNMVRLVLPSAHATAEATPLELKDFAPQKSSLVPNDPITMKIRGLSQILSRTYLLLVAQIFRCLPRHLNDRNELTVLIDGINRILLEHGSDIGIVSHALIGEIHQIVTVSRYLMYDTIPALMVASTRFRRLFASGGGYTLFMPALLKVYAECEAHTGIRHAIEYAVNRFYSHHQETFLFQSLSAVSQVFFLPGAEGEWIGKHVYSLFASLRKNASLNSPDEAGIHNVNKSQEREALMFSTAEEKPQAFLSAFRGKEGQNAKLSVPAELPQELEAKHLRTDDLVRLFLTVIAHDLTIARAEQFLRLLRFLTPHFYEATSSARNVLRDGIEALGVIFFRAVKTKPLDPTATQIVENVDIRKTMDTNPSYEEQLAEKTKAASDLTAMRMDYLHLVAAYTRAGGKVTSNGSRMTFEAVKAILREGVGTENVSSVLGEYVRMASSNPDGKSLKAVVHLLREMAPIVSGYATALDFSPVFDTIAELTENPVCAHDPAFCEVVVQHICEAGISACEQAATDKQLHNVSWRPALVRLISCSLLLENVDCIAQLARHRPTYELLMYVVLPLALSMKTTADLDMSGKRIDPSLRDAQMRAWIRLLSYTVACCEKTQTSEGSTSGLTRSRSRDSRNSEAYKKTQLPLLLVALQIIKVLVVKGAKDLTSCLPDVWIRLGGLLRTLLADGSGEFTLRTDNSPAPSPTPSPRASGQFDFSRADMSLGVNPLSLGAQTYHSPRFLDYCLWSISELICVYRTPLFLQMRSFMHEKVYLLEKERRYLENSLPPGLSPGPRPRRPSSVFSKPRFRRSNTPSPEASPLLRATNPFEPGEASVSSLRPDSLGVGYRPIPPLMSYNSNSSARDSLSIPSDQSSSSAPRIVHLGLISPSHQRSMSPGPGGARSMMKLAMADSTRVRSLALVKQTYSRIRIVQSSLGYPPLPSDSGADDLSRGREVWTKSKALKEIVKETRELMEEFEEGAIGLTTESEAFVNATDFSDFSGSM
ncbi:hypothetical protein V5O48_008326 [Marasmius crinis-equi]|uniref:Protein UNC80 C-terminal domain-containing protein n=1 Tax=Marasmius crinis-equi TaxID=585013 RepID=A0ABR3FEM7_9AGAR